MELKIIARVENGFVSKFGIPRQSGLCPALSRIVFEPEYRSPEALRGLESFSHLWLIWQFSEVGEGKFSPTVRPPRLGGNKRVGVFASRSPFRPNPIGLSCVRLERIEQTPRGSVLVVSGADLMNGTPIFDIKPYLGYSDSIPDAVSGFAEDFVGYKLEVSVPPELWERVRPEDREALLAILKNDPRPSYQHDPEREYFFEYGSYSLGFKVSGGILNVTKLEMRQKIEE